MNTDSDSEIDYSTFTKTQLREEAKRLNIPRFHKNRRAKTKLELIYDILHVSETQSKKLISKKNRFYRASITHIGITYTREQLEDLSRPIVEDIALANGISIYRTKKINLIRSLTQKWSTQENNSLNIDDISSEGET